MQIGKQQPEQSIERQDSLISGQVCDMAASYYRWYISSTSTQRKQLQTLYREMGGRNRHMM